MAKFLKITNVTGFSHAIYHKNYENAKKNSKKLIFKGDSEPLLIYYIL